MMPAKNKARGNRLERLIVKDARALGLSAKRSYASNGEALGEDERVDGIVGDYRFQAKMRKKLVKMLREAQECFDNDVYDAYIVKQDRKDPMVIMPFYEWLYLIEQSQKIDV